MPVVDLEEARDVSQVIQRALEASSLPDAQRALQSLFVEQLDFASSSGTVPLRAEGLPSLAIRLAHRDGVQVVAVQVLERRRVLKQTLDRTLAEIRRNLAGDVLLLATDADRGQWHFVYPGI